MVLPSELHNNQPQIASNHSNVGHHALNVWPPVRAVDRLRTRIRTNSFDSGSFAGTGKTVLDYLYVYEGAMERKGNVVWKPTSTVNNSALYSTCDGS